MKILSAQQIKAWDAFTIQHEPISSINLMERAATKCVEWIEQHDWKNQAFRIFCGKGNNGGDGLAITRMLFEKGFDVSVYILEFGKPGTPDFQMNLQRLHDIGFTEIYFLQSNDNLPAIAAGDIIVDALFGSGLNKPLQGLAAEITLFINASNAMVISIDLPTGLFMDASSRQNSVVRASHTLTFQCYKLALLMQENAPFIGTVHVLDIGLHPSFLTEQEAENILADAQLVQDVFQPRKPFSHKGNFGHALLLAGSYGKMGAAVLAAKACLHSGVGLLTCLLPRCGYYIMQTAVPEAMVITDDNENVIAQLPKHIENYAAIGVGPGIGTATETQKMISFMVRRSQKPLVMDADGLNCLAQDKALLDELPEGSILTPHPKEFDRLFGEQENDFARLQTAKQFAAAHNIIIVLKSHHTTTVTPSGKVIFNSTGNAGMAKGGSGDVLTGMITALLAQNYKPEDAAVLGVYLHGLAGDFAAAALSQEAMTATDIITFLSQAFLSTAR